MSKSSKQCKAPPPAPLTMTEALAVAIAFANAAATFDTIKSRSASGGDRLPAGRFWYAGGEALEARQADPLIEAMVELVRAHGAVPADALYLRVSALNKRIARGTWCDLELADRLAFTTFASSLPPLLVEARREADAVRLAAQAEALQPELPDRDLGYRTIRRSATIGDRLVLGSPAPARLLPDAAE